MKKYIYLVLTLFITFHVHAESKKHMIDSMLNVLSDRPEIVDTNKVKLLVNITWTYSDIDASKGIDYGIQATQLATKLGWKKGEAYAYRALGDCYMLVTNNQQALDCYKKSLAVSEEMRNKALISGAIGNIAIVYFQQGDYQSALREQQKSLALSQELGNKKDIACSLNSIANIYMHQGYYAQSLNFHFQALKIFEQTGARLNIANTHVDIANIYNYQSDSGNALPHYREALRQYESISNYFGIVTAYICLGNVYEVKGVLDKSLDYYRQALKVQYDSKELRTKIIGNIAIVCARQKKYEEAIEYLLTCIRTFQSTGSKPDIALSLIQLGTYMSEMSVDSAYIRRKKLPVMVEPEFRQYVTPISLPSGKSAMLSAANKYFEEALEISRQINARPLMQQSYEGLDATFREMGNYKKALAYADSARMLRDSIYSHESSNKLTQLRLQNEYDRKYLTDSLTHVRDVQVRDFRLRQQRLVFYSSFAFLLLATGSIVWVQRSKTRRARAAEQTLFSRQLLDAELKGLRAQMNPHFIFNCLNSIQALILKENKAEASEYLRKFSKLIRLILDNAQKTSNTIDDETEILSLYLDMEKMRLKNKFSYEIHIAEDINPGFTEIPSMVLQPLVENSIWHGLMNAPQAGRLKIEFTKENNKLTCTVEDNGIGLEISKAGKTSTHESKGIKLIRDRLQAWSEMKGLEYNFTITDNIDSGAGTRASIIILYPAYA